MSQELVSVIMPTYNSGRFLPGSIDSILAQTYKNLELLITDDGSNDAYTLQLLKEYSEKDARVKVEYLEGNNGPGVARNKSIERAQGRYIAFCDSDDRWLPTKLEKQIALMESKGCSLCCASYILCDTDDKETGLVIPPEVISFTMMKHDNKIGCLTAVYDTKKLGQKFYLPEIRKRQDWVLFLSIIKRSGPAYALTEPLAFYRQRDNSISSKKFSLIKYNIKVYEIILGYPKWKASLYFLFIFIPTYYLKVLKRNIDSRNYLRKKELNKE
ncbi:MAG: glycosyltransferase family 2 protein [Prevotella sp.]|nr:glycosyltransferase family 2 protein [Prevotella sp.]